MLGAQKPLHLRQAENGRQKLLRDLVREKAVAVRRSFFSRVHWVEPKLVAEITYLTWTTDNLLRHTVYVGLREDKPADQVRREPSKPR
jgi:bifunctional non-homologous end joining protein LigD